MALVMVMGITYIIEVQTTSNGENNAHNPKNVFEKREDRYIEVYK